MFENKYQENDYCELIDTKREVAGQAPCEQFPDAFHPSRGDNHLITAAKSLCQQCPIKALCAEYGIKWENDGIYGGMTGYERAVIRRKRQNAGEVIASGLRVRKDLEALAR